MDNIEKKSTDKPIDISKDNTSKNKQSNKIEQGKSGNKELSKDKDIPSKNKGHF